MSYGKIGNFELKRKLGEGGMGEVFLATDPRLGRDVALKVLPASFANDPVLMVRFEREARVLASLNHPNIAMIHGIEESGGTKAIVMELVPGEDLSARIGRGPVPVDEALGIAIQIARALEAAHQKGIVHRDLKPANVRITPDGTVKVLDFGVAKSVEGDADPAGDPALTPTVSIHTTQRGALVGTAPYMSPEQARGRAVDARSDIFSFGCLLFEMLAGGRAFVGEDVSEILASVIKRDVRWDALPKGVPEPLRRVIARCLAARVDERYQAIGDVRYDLARFLEDPASLAEPEMEGLSRRLVTAAVALALFGGAVAGGAFVAWRSGGTQGASTPAPLVKFAIDAPGADNVCLSPDGSRVAYAIAESVFVRRLDRLESARVTLPWDAGPVAWSKDGRTLIVLKPDRKNGELWTMAGDGGAPRLAGALPAEGFFWGADAREDGQIVVGMAFGGLFSIPISGGAATRLLAPQPGELLVAPAILPDGRTIVFTEAGSGRIEAWDGRARRVVLQLEGDRIFDAVYSPPGFLLFRHTGSRNRPGVWAVPFSTTSLSTTGPAFRVGPYGGVSASQDGTIAYRELSTDAFPRRLVWVGRDGKVLGTIGEPLRGMRHPAISQDGGRIAVAGLDADAVFLDLFVIDGGSGARYPLHDDAGSDRFPFWRDANTLGFTTWSAGIRHLRERSVDGKGEARLLDDHATNAGVSRDGRYTWFSYDGLRYLERGGTAPRTIASEGWHYADISANDRFIAILRRGEPGIIVQRFPDGTGVTAVTSLDCVGVRWSADGKELYFWSADDRFMAVPFDTAAADPKPGSPRALFTASPGRFLVGQEFDVSPDGRLLMVQDIDDGSHGWKDPGIVVIQNWHREFTASNLIGGLQ